MKLLGQPVAGMYVWAIALLCAMAFISSYSMHMVPLDLLVSVTTCTISDILITKFYFRRKLRVPFSGIITGIILGSVAATTTPLTAIILACVVAIGSKAFIRIKSVNVFNPAALGLLVAILLFSTSDEWWASSAYNLAGIFISITPVMLILAYLSKRLTSSFSFVIASILLSVFLSPSSLSLSVASVDAIIFSINFYLAFVMMADPKTSPSGRLQQAVFGASIAILLVAFGILRLPSPTLTALLVGNIGFALSKRYIRTRTIRAPSVAYAVSPNP
jgi:Na+-transporting NADH:ubiquinone oxidoreductase subunit NqrB